MEKAMKANADVANKHIYSSPHLVVYGNIGELTGTAGRNSATADGGGAPGRSKTN